MTLNKTAPPNGGCQQQHIARSPHRRVLYTGAYPDVVDADGEVADRIDQEISDQTEVFFTDTRGAVDDEHQVKHGGRGGAGDFLCGENAR